MIGRFYYAITEVLGMATKSNKISFSRKKQELAEMLANPDFNGTITDLCTKIDIARSTFYKWLDDEDYTDYIQSLIDKYTDGELALVWKALIFKCKSGDVPAIKLYFELKGKYKQNVEVRGSLDTGMQKLDEIIGQLRGGGDG